MTRHISFACLSTVIARAGDHRRRHGLPEHDVKPSEIAVSDRGTLRGLTQFRADRSYLLSQLAEYKPHPGTLGFEGGFCDNQIRTARKSLILKRRDVGVVDRARLENDSGDAHRVIPKHFFAQSIQRLPATECFSDVSP